MNLESAEPKLELETLAPAFRFADVMDEESFHRIILACRHIWSLAY